MNSLLHSPWVFLMVPCVFAFLRESLSSSSPEHKVPSLTQASNWLTHRPQKEDHQSFKASCFIS